MVRRILLKFYTERYIRKTNDRIEKRMEVIIWIAAAIIVYFIGTGKKQEQEKNRKEKLYLGCFMFAALCCELAIKVVFHIHYLSIWLILTYALIAAQCSRMLWIFICIPEKRNQVYSMSIKMAACKVYL